MKKFFVFVIVVLGAGSLLIAILSSLSLSTVKHSNPESANDYFDKAALLYQKVENQNAEPTDDSFTALNTAAVYLSRISNSDPQYRAAQELDKKIKALRTTMMTKQNINAKPEDNKSISVSSSWHYYDQSDAMRDKPSKFACVTSENMIAFGFPYGTVSAELCLRDSPEYGKDVMLSVTKGHFLCRYNGCTVNVKFSDKKILKYTAAEPSDYSTNILFIRNFKSFVKNLKTSKETIIEAEFYQQGSRQMIFNTENLDW